MHYGYSLSGVVIDRLFQVVDLVWFQRTIFTLAIKNLVSRISCPQMGCLQLLQYIYAEGTTSFSCFSLAKEHTFFFQILMKANGEKFMEIFMFPARPFKLYLLNIIKVWFHTRYHTMCCAFRFADRCRMLGCVCAAQSSNGIISPLQGGKQQGMGFCQVACSCSGLLRWGFSRLKNIFCKLFIFLSKRLNSKMELNGITITALKLLNTFNQKQQCLLFPVM